MVSVDVGATSAPLPIMEFVRGSGSMSRSSTMVVVRVVECGPMMEGSNGASRELHPCAALLPWASSILAWPWCHGEVEENRRGGDGRNSSKG